MDLKHISHRLHTLILASRPIICISAIYAGKWRITIGSKINRTDISLVYDTTDFKTYEQLHTLLHKVPNTGMWESVYFYPVSKTTVKGLDTSVNGPDVKHIVKASMDDTMIDHYAIGTYFNSNGTWIPDDPTIDVGISTSLRYDYGKFYASKTFYDQNKGRRILWGWIGESDSESADVQKGWSSLQVCFVSLTQHGVKIRTVVLDTKTGKNLVQWPVEEVKSLRLSSKKFDMEVGPGSLVHVDVGSATQLDIEVDFEIKKEALDKILGDALAAAEAEEFSCQKNGGSTVSGALGPFGHRMKACRSKLRLLLYMWLREKIQSSKHSSAQTPQGHLLQTMSSNRFTGVPYRFIKGEKLTMIILVDHPIVEAFGQSGRTCITSRVYPTKAIYGAAKLFLFNNAIDATITATFNVWQMNSDFIHPCSEEAVRALSRI
ncbi:hypothetical protein Bca4012_061484 [Brassica carinata]